MKPNERRKTVLGNRQLYQLLKSAVGGVVECLEVTSAVGWLASGQAKRSARPEFPLSHSPRGWNPLTLIDIQKHHTAIPTHIVAYTSSFQC
jgi:hypothetical protein